MKNFTQVDNKKLLNTDVSDGAFRTFLVIFSHAKGSHKAFPSIGTIAKERGKDNRSISNHLVELKRAGWLNWNKRGYSMSNLYSFTDAEKFSSTWKKTASQYGRKLQPNNTEVNKTEDNNIDFGNLKPLEEMRKQLIGKLHLKN